MQQALQGRPFKLTPLLAAKRVAYRAIASAGNAQMWWRSNWLDGVVEYSSQQSRPASQPEG